MDGSMGLEAALEQRLAVINCTPADIQAFLQAHPPCNRLTPVSGGRDHPAAWRPGSAHGARIAAAANRRLAARDMAPLLRACWLARGVCLRESAPQAWRVQGAKELIKQLQSRGVAIYLIRQGPARGAFSHAAVRLVISLS
jgi:hypothetical protein